MVAVTSLLRNGYSGHVPASEMSQSHPSLKLLVCSHLHHGLLGEEVVVVVCIWSHSKLATYILNILAIKHGNFEVQVFLWDAMGE